MEEKNLPAGLVVRAWNLYRKSFVPAAAVIALYTGIWLVMNLYLLPENLTVNPQEASLNPGFLAKIFAGAGLLGLLSLFSLLFVVSLTASRHENRPWTWAQGFHMALEKIFPFAFSVLMIFFQLLALTMVASVIFSLVSGSRDDAALSLILTVQLAAAGILSTLFLMIYALLPQVLLVEKVPFFLGLRRAAYLSRRRRLRILGFLILSWSPVILIQVYAVLATLGSQSGWPLPHSEGLIRFLGYLSQGLGVVITPFFLSGTTSLYYEARSKEISVEA